MKALTRKQVAQILGVTGATIWNWRNNGILTPCMTTVGGHCRYDPLEVIRLAEQITGKKEEVKL